ncbi:DegT/DnrJ/EryC1/StrS family aminotransferase [Microseira wollei]|uniref:DegT/DnrJ/EryC1/StrS aminotransferase n=1 Tax=Microseira wollei NIES-4236 TaxID=2530354 RepID=A0AAV3XFA6_9CYAN|nr:DegT/DnrJ/EryC1/StrS family aminotransferase [Microseira wollei]GET39555.1 DegT/DnrJ/EryC1/StrS aminotransferase [Microseira wollei NIES-4236]
MSNIPPVDLAQQYQIIAEEVNAAVLSVLSSGRYIGGNLVESFEQQFASYTGVSECIACNSGTDALYLALRSLGIGSQDQVITTPFTFIATAEAISAVGATPVFVDIDPETFNLDLNQIESAITCKTKAIIPVHLFGQPVDMTRLMAIAFAHNLFVIEDCAQATGAEWAGRKVGSIGHIGCFSFFPTKNLGACGDGGAVTTNDSAIATQIRRLREHGTSSRYYHEAIGINSRLDALQAAIVQIKLRYLDTWNAQRSEIATRYQDLLSPIPGIILPQAPTKGKTVWNQFTIRVIGTDEAATRDRVRSQMQEKGVSSMVYYPLPLHLQPVYQGLPYQQGSFPAAEQACHQVLSLPIFPELSIEQQKRVVYALKESLVNSQQGRVLPMIHAISDN